MSTELSTQTFPNINSRVNDTHTLQITQRKLKDTNSLEWSQSNIENWYLTGATAASKEGEPGFQSWKSANTMVIAWLVNSMNLKIGHRYLFYKSLM